MVSTNQFIIPFIYRIALHFYIIVYDFPRTYDKFLSCLFSVFVFVSTRCS